MKNIIFSQNTFNIECGQFKGVIDKNSYFSCQDDRLKIYYDEPYFSSVDIFTPKAKTCNLFKVQEFNNLRLIEILSCSLMEINHTFSTSSANVYVYKNSLMLIYNNDTYCYYYYDDANLKVTEIGECVYIFNNSYMVTFDLNKKVFSHFFVDKKNIEKNSIIILCKLPKNINYYILFVFDLKKNIVTKKKYKKPLILKENLIYYLIFYLSKNGFDDIEKFIGNNLKKQQLFSYFSNFENIYFLNNECYVTKNKTIEKITFKVERCILVDLD